MRSFAVTIPKTFTNPFRPGAGHVPPYLAGRDDEKREFEQFLRQEVITDNPIITGLRGVGKTVLLEELKAIAIASGWLWVGTDMTESASLTEDNLAVRLLADLSAVTSTLEIDRVTEKKFGFTPDSDEFPVTLNYDALCQMYSDTPGLCSDKLKAVLQGAAAALPAEKKGVIFAYDEAQNLEDHAKDKQFPLSLLIDVFQSIQRQNLPILLVLVGLPTLFPKLVEARTSAERMFHIIHLDRLAEGESRQAIVKPIKQKGCPIHLDDKLIGLIVAESGGYPYFIQFISREVYDVALQKQQKGEPLTVSIPGITRKLDADFFSGRWAKATDRQRELLRVIAALDESETEFTVLAIVQKAKDLVAAAKLESGFSASLVNQMLNKLCLSGFVYKNRHGKYSFAVPLLGRFIRRQSTE